MIHSVSLEARQSPIMLYPARTMGSTSPANVHSHETWESINRNKASDTLPSPSRSHVGNQGELDFSETSVRTILFGQPPSPPASPWVSHHRRHDIIESTTSSISPAQSLHDSPPYDGHQSAIHQDSLFPQLPCPSYNARWKGHEDAYHFVKPKRKRDCRTRRFQVPTGDDTKQMLSLSSNLVKTFNSNPGNYFKRTREETPLERPFAKARFADRNGSLPTQPVVPAERRTGQGINRPSSKGALQAMSTTGLKTVPSYPLTERTRAPHTRAPSIKRPEDIHFEALPDLSPPTSSLPANNKSLKIDWSSHNPLDLSADPHRHLLHEAEVALASTLRLSCATYLCSKRRIFLKLREAYQTGREFRKTDAQQACQIDVNKASKLWIAFEKVGWFSQAWLKH